MIIRASQIQHYIDPQKQQKFSLRQQSGQGVDLIDLWELEALVDQGMVCARVRGRRIKWVELIVPLGAAKRIIAQTRPRSEASQTVVRQKVEGGRAEVRVFAHHPRCFRWLDNSSRSTA